MLRFADGIMGAGEGEIAASAAPDIVWTVPGHGKISGTHRGPEEVYRFAGRWLTSAISSTCSNSHSERARLQLSSGEPECTMARTLTSARAASCSSMATGSQRSAPFFSDIEIADRYFA